MLHPIRVQIVESIRRARRPLSAAELTDRLGGAPSAVRTACHLRRLRRLGVILPSDSRPGRQALTQRYSLKEKPET